MKRALDVLDELRDIVLGKPGFEITEIAGRYLKGPPPGGGAVAFQPPAQRLVDDLVESRPALCDSVLSLAATSSSGVSAVRMCRCYNRDIMMSKDRTADLPSPYRSWRILV
jgi:hypothetical protein